MAFVRKVKTASGATAVQIVEKRHGVRRIVTHVGSAHDETELAVLMASARDRETALSRAPHSDVGLQGPASAVPNRAGP